MRRTLKEIRLELGFSFRDMADVLEIKKSTWQGYEIGRRAVPREIQTKALNVLRKDRAFWRGLPKRVDQNLAGRVCPNEAVKEE